jgi:L-rhamnose mutarotase
MSTVLSSKYFDPGHIKRIDFVKFLESKNMDVDVFGSNEFNYKRYKGSLPYAFKDDGLFPYKYTFNVENKSVLNYVTEKLADGILSECLTFYSGCKNASCHFDERAFVYLELEDFEHDYNVIKTMIENDEWSKRIEYIRLAKQKILNEQQFYPRIAKIINDHEEKVNK